MSYILTPFLTRIFTFWDWNVLWSFLAPEKWLMLNKMVTNKLWLFLQTKKYRQRKLNTFSQRPTQLISGRCRIQVVCFLSVTWASNNYRIPLNLKDLAHSLKKKKLILLLHRTQFRNHCLILHWLFFIYICYEFSCCQLWTLKEFYSIFLWLRLPKIFISCYN